jgi:ubiquinone biosynthesis protein COQ4
MKFAPSFIVLPIKIETVPARGLHGSSRFSKNEFTTFIPNDRLRSFFMRDLRTQLVLWLARTLNPQVQANYPLQIELEKFRQLPDGTLGREVARFIDENQFTPITEGDLIQRTHDVWHVLTGFSPSTEDEFKLQAFTRAQVFRPTSALLVLYGIVTRRVNPRDAIASLQSGHQAEDLIDWDISADWDKPLDEVRQRLGIVPHTAPNTAPHKKAEPMELDSAA